MQMVLSKKHCDLHLYTKVHISTQPCTHLFKGEPAAGRVGRVGRISQSFQGIDYGIAIGLLEPGFMWRLCWSCCDAADVIQGENHGTHQSRVLITHNGNLFIPAAQQRV